ncbi:MAG TPA: carboxypeptidase-like regulatory domain-containing protein [Terriglobia bacterium]|nr:carboxypeptidase-like regulatory domain-containing protein [Terriglobia bacterium]
MRGGLISLASVLFLVSLPVVMQAQGRIQGAVSNGTNGQPVANQAVQLLLPRGGMQRVATATTDASGRFVFPSANIDPSSFYLVQAAYQGVDYNAPAQFDSEGTANVSITVYDASASAPPLRIQSARLVIHAQGNKAHVQEMFAIRNASDPPLSYADPDGTFRFRLSPGTPEPSAVVAGLMNMPLPQPVNPGKGRGEYFLKYPLKPGVTVVMVAYDVDYGSNHLALGDSYPYPISSAELLVSPPSLKVDSPLFGPAGTDVETGSQRYVATGLRQGTKLEARLSGEAAGSEAGGSEAAESAQGEAQVRILPNPITRLEVPLLACFLLLLLWALGIRLAKEWPRFMAQRKTSSLQKELAATADALFNSLADLDELFAGGKVPEKQYWKERLDLKARLMATLKKASPRLLESYATRHIPSR